MKHILLLLSGFLFTAAALHAQAPSDDGTFTAVGASDLKLNTGTTTRLTILNTNGFVGVGITPSEKFHVDGNILSTGSITSTGGVTSALFSATAGNFNSVGSSNLNFLTNGTLRLSVLNANGFVGIGGITPTEMLHVNGNVLSSGDVSSANFFSANGNFSSGSSSNLSLQTNGTSRLTILSADGNVGIGTAMPEHKLHVAGNLLLDNATPSIYTGTGSDEHSRYLHLVNAAGLSSSSGLKAGGILVSDSYAYANPSKNDLVVKGKVAIGTPLTSNPNSYTLAVNGKIGAKDVQIERNSTAWPDYVFAPTYRLPSLSEVEQYIRANRHLQDVPSAKEIEANGHSVGDMDAILLKKVEELTLYIIEQQKRIDALEKKLAEKK